MFFLKTFIRWSLPETYLVMLSVEVCSGLKTFLRPIFEVLVFWLLVSVLVSSGHIYPLNAIYIKCWYNFVFKLPLNANLIFIYWKLTFFKISID